jgi:hypothetical protein
MDWIEILKALGVSTAGQILLLIAFGFWGRKLIEYFFSESIELKKIELQQSLELHKQKIEQENELIKLDIDKELEGYKNKLELLRLEYQVQFSKLHEKRSEILELIYHKLFDLNQAMLELTTFIRPATENPNKEESERLTSTNQVFHDFNTYYRKHKIYLTPETCIILDKLVKHYWVTGLDVAEVRNARELVPVDNSYFKDAMTRYRAAYKELRDEIPNVLLLLETDFRKILGVIR